MSTSELPRALPGRVVPLLAPRAQPADGVGIDVVLRQVAADRARRDAMAAATGGSRGIPTLVAGDEVISGHDEIIDWLDARYAERDDVELHRAKRRADWPAWRQIHGRHGPLG